MDKKEFDRLSYALGLSMGNNFRSSGIESIQVQDFADGVAAVFYGEEPKMSYNEAKATIQEFFTELQKKQEAAAAAMADVNAKAGQEFLDANGKRVEVKTMPSGLQYEILEAGEGESPKAGDTSRCPLGRGPAADEARSQMASVHPLATGIRPAGCRRHYRPQPDADFRCRAYRGKSRQMIRRLSLLLLISLSAACVKAQTAVADSLDRAVAVFFASQFKVAFANGLADLRATGIDVDSASVIRLIAGEIEGPSGPAGKAPGALVLPSGVVVETVKDGTGACLTRSDNVTMRYEGRLPDGTVFDSIGEDEEPLTSPVNQFVAGMTEGLTHMRPGGRYILTIPADMAYGAHGVQGVIPPHCALQFDITVI